MRTVGNTKGLIFDIKRFALHDGPGIRTTVFIKGCPLRCPWCHNPEGIRPFPEFLYRKQRCLDSCLECVNACPQGIDIREEWCNLQLVSKCIAQCNKCSEVCPTEAITIVGKEMEVQEVLSQVLSDRVFYEISGGGVTLSGGEPLFSGQFTLALVKAFKSAGLHTALETCCYGDIVLVEEVLNYLDLIIVDIKFGDPGNYEDLVAADNGEVIFRNLDVILAANVIKIIRFPCIPGYTDEAQNVTAIVEYLKHTPLQNVKRIEVLPYNPLCENKYQLLGMDAPALPNTYRLHPMYAVELLARSSIPVTLLSF